MRRPNATEPSVDDLGVDNGNFMKQLLTTLDDFVGGDCSARLPSSWTGLKGRVADRINHIARRLENFNTSLLRLRRRVGEEGNIGERLPLGDSVGSWAERIEAINALVDELSQPTVEVGRVIGAVAKGDLSQAMPLELGGRPLKGEYLRTAKLVNGMVGQFGAFSVEVIRVAREVGTEGKLGGQAKVKGVSGVWKELTEAVNQMAGNLTAQVRNIAEVTTAVARGDLSRKITVDVRGEILELKNTINTMVDQLNGFAAEVTRVAREVGTEGKLGGQAEVPGVDGTWKDLTDNVNSMANNLTTQVRNIAEVTIAVANGDLSRKITVDVRGEILQLKETINTMTAKQVEFAKNIHSSGSDLLNLITDILDLSKIESGTVTVEAEEINFPSLCDSVERNFRHFADAKNLPFRVDFDPNLPRAMSTDPKRLQQILKNPLSNAFKFTAQGHVEVKVRVVAEGWTPGHPVLSRAAKVVSFAISDTGIGIAPEKQRLIFEAFQQADAGTNRKYGGNWRTYLAVRAG
jgi:signal transduction histidine kinase